MGGLKVIPITSKGVEAIRKYHEYLNTPSLKSRLLSKFIKGKERQAKTSTMDVANEDISLDPCVITCVVNDNYDLYRDKLIATWKVAYIKQFGKYGVSMDDFKFEVF